VLDASLRAEDGTELAVHRWPVPARTARRGAVLVAHGLGEHAGRYDHVGRHLSALGLDVWAYDHRGHGRSGGDRGAIPHADALLHDLQRTFGELAVRSARAGDEAPPFLLGHSMGGAVAALAATEGWVQPRGLILSSPALALRISPLQRVLMTTAGLLAPNHAAPNGLALSGLSHDPAIATAYAADAHNHDRLTPRLAQFLERAGQTARRLAPSFDVPTLMLVAGDDRLIDPAGARAFYEALPEGVGTLHWYEDLFHEVFNEREPDRGTVLGHLSAWLTHQLAERGTSAPAA
jgi:alpha-beta hydrolase superfamily lysophospholipase